MSLKRIALLLFLVTTSIIMVSCFNKMPFDPRAYNRTDDLDLEGGLEEEDGGDIEIPTDPDNDPFKDPEYSDPNKHFSSNQFDRWEIRAIFAKNNAPTYSFTGGGWNPGNSAKNEYSKDGPSSSGGGYGISGITYYLYKEKNPMFSPTSSYNTGPHGQRMERFYFYRFTGTGGGVQWLDNMLVAVDRYTKLVFAFAIPTKYNNVLGNNVPVAWGSADSHVQNGKYKFYEYDPVGIVKKDGSFELYKWYTDAMGSGKYDPIIGSPDREVATYGRAGRSPYYTLSSSTTGDSFRDAVKSKEYLYRTQEAGRSDILDMYAFSMDGKTLIYRAEKWRDGEIKKDNYKHKKTINKNRAVYSRHDGMDVTIDIVEEGKEIRIQQYNGFKGRIDFVDPGPKFADRVKGRVFEGSGYTYTFSSDGGYIDLSNKHRYWLTWRDAKTFAVYQRNGLIGVNWGVNIRNYEKSDGTVVIDGRITWTGGSWAMPGTTPPSDAWYSPADLVK